MSCHTRTIMLSLLVLTALSASANALPGLFGSDPKITKYYCVQNCTGVANGATSKADYSQISNVDWKTLAIVFGSSTLALFLITCFLIYLYNRSTSSRALVNTITHPKPEITALTENVSRNSFETADGTISDHPHLMNAQS